MTGHFEQVIPEGIENNETLAAVYTDLRHLLAMVRIHSGYQDDALPHLERVLMVGFTRCLTVREREVVKRLCRLAKGARLNELFTAGEWQDLPRKIDSLLTALSPAEEMLLKRVASQLLQDAFNPQWPGTERVVAAWLRLETTEGKGVQDGQESAGAGGRQALIPTMYAQTYQPWLGKRKPTDIMEVGLNSGRFVVVLPGMRKTHQMEFLSRSRTRKENYLVSLQRLVHETLGRPVASKIVVGSLYLHQQHVREGGNPNDFITVGVDQMARLIGTGTINKNRTIDAEFQTLFSRTFFLLSMARLVWVPDQWTPNARLDWIRSPLYHIGYEGGFGDEWSDASIIAYRPGDLFTNTLYRSGRFGGAVAPLDLDLYFSWHSFREAEEQCLHLYYTQMFQMNLDSGGIYQATVGEIMDNAGLPLPDPSHTGQRYDRFLKAHETLRRKNIIGNYHIDDPSAPFMDRTITVEPSEALLRRLWKASQNPSPFMLEA